MVLADTAETSSY